MSKASEQALSSLHAQVAEVLTARLSQPIRETHKDEDGVVITELVEGSEGLGCSSADIAAAIAFLKNNGITADPEDNEDLRNLSDQLAKKRKDTKLRMNDLTSASEQFEAHLNKMQ